MTDSLNELEIEKKQVLNLIKTKNYKLERIRKQFLFAKNEIEELIQQANEFSQDKEILATEARNFNKIKIAMYNELNKEFGRISKYEDLEENQGNTSEQQ